MVIAKDKNIVKTNKTVDFVYWVFVLRSLINILNHIRRQTYI